MSAVAGRGQAAASSSPRGLAAANRSPVVSLIAFGALAAFGTGHWARLLQAPPEFRLAPTVAVAFGLAAALSVIGRLALPRVALHAAAAAATGAGIVVALVVAGLPAGLLEPARWDDLAGEVDRGLAGIRNVGWPYAGPDESVRLAVTLGAPLLLTVAAALAFWPLRRGVAAARGLALVALLALYAVPATEHDPGRPLLWGAVLLALVAAWLWLPRVPRKEGVAAAVALLAATSLALPVAAGLDADAALLDYRAWNWFGGEDVTFDWNHSYGPLDWPREGTTLLNVRARRPHYWRAETLDRFDGLRWVRSNSNERTRPLTELPPRPDRRWDERIRVTVRALRTDFVVAAGTPYVVSGAGESVTGSADGTLRRLDEPLRRGDAYTVRTYAPNPSAGELRAAPEVYQPLFAQYTTVVLPPRGENALDRQPRGVQHGPPRGMVVELPPWGAPEGDRRGAARRRLANSPYAKTFGLAERLAAGAPTVYDAVKRVERHLQRTNAYSERPPSRRYPLESFLFEDRIGYCQQFSGAMALMLRMVGIPARVVAGFSPGSLDRDKGEYRVRDLDAHSWVEVYFTGIGWVTFDPTPAAAPADRPGRESEPAGAVEEGAGSVSSGSGASPAGDRPQRSADGGSGETGGDARLLAVLALVAGALAAAGLAARRRHRRGLIEAGAADASLREVQRALPRLGWELTPGTTLLELERRLGSVAGSAAAGYVSRLRDVRFARGRVRAPSAEERRALRRELTAGRGLRLRLRGFLALPPRRPFSGP